MTINTSNTNTLAPSDMPDKLRDMALYYERAIVQVKRDAQVTQEAYPVMAAAMRLLPEEYRATLEHASYGSSGWVIRMYPPKAVDITRFLQFLYKNGYRFSTRFPKEIQGVTTTAFLHKDHTYRLMLIVDFSLSETCSVVTVSKETIVREKRMLVCADGVKMLPTTEIPSLESGDL